MLSVTIVIIVISIDCTVFFFLSQSCIDKTTRPHGLFLFLSVSLSF